MGLNHLGRKPVLLAKWRRLVARHALSRDFGLLTGQLFYCLACQATGAVFNFKNLEMASTSVIARFDGDEGKRRLRNRIEKQVVTGGDPTIAADIAEVVNLCDVSTEDVLIVSGASDNDLFLILQGAFRIIVNGRDVALRKAGQHVGEMAIIDPSAPRSASVVDQTISA